MNKRAEVGQIGFIFLAILFMINWFVWLGEWIGQVGQKAIVDNGLTGIEAFMYANLNVWIFIIFLLGMIGFGYFTLGEWKRQYY